MTVPIPSSRSPMKSLINGLALDAVQPPLRRDEGGAVRVGNSRISLDLLVEQYEHGMTPEDMVRAYDPLVLADIYAVIAYYLQHRDAVRVYRQQRAEEAEAMQAKVEADHPPVSREELLARRRATEKADAPAGQSRRTGFAGRDRGIDDHDASDGRPCLTPNPDTTHHGV